MAGRGGFPFPVLAVFAVILLSRVLSEMDFDSDFLEDLPFLLAVGAFVLFRVFSSGKEAKRRGPVPTPMPTPTQETKAETIKRELGFKIPTLRNAPKAAQPQAEPTDEELDALRRDSYERHLAEKQAREEKMEQERLRREHQKRETKAAEREAWSFSPDALRNAVIWSEIMAPPKALRRR